MKEDEGKAAFESSLGRVPIRRSVNSGRVLTVNDATDTEQLEQDNRFDPPDEELEKIKELEKIRYQKQLDLKRAPEGAKRRIDLILGIARENKDVEVDGVIFSLRTLKSREMREVLSSIMSIETAAMQAFELRAQTIARSLYAMDGQDFGLVIGSDKIENKILTVQEFDETLLNHLYTKYSELVEEHKKKFQPELGKDEKEVVENLKKL